MIKDLEQNDPYRYLIVYEGDEIQHAKLKKKNNSKRQKNKTGTVFCLQKTIKQLLRYVKYPTLKQIFTSHEHTMEECLIQNEIAYKSITIGLDSYLSTKEDSHAIFDSDHERTKKISPVHHDAAKFRRV